jgi:hypothetical protein
MMETFDVFRQSREIGPDQQYGVQRHIRRPRRHRAVMRRRLAVAALALTPIETSLR